MYMILWCSVSHQTKAIFFLELISDAHLPISRFLCWFLERVFSFWWIECWVFLFLLIRWRSEEIIFRFSFVGLIVYRFLLKGVLVFWFLGDGSFFICPVKHLKGLSLLDSVIGFIKMKDFIGTPGTFTGLFLRISQFVFAAASIASMATAAGFANYTAFWYLLFYKSCLLTFYMILLMDIYMCCLLLSQLISWMFWIPFVGDELFLFRFLTGC